MSEVGPLPEGLRRGVHEAYDKSHYGRFMMCVARVQDDTISPQDACADVFNILGYDGGRRRDNGNMRGRPCHNGNMHRDHTSQCRRPDLYQMFVEWSTAAPAAVKQEKTDVALSRVPGPLPEGLRMGVYESARVSAHGGLRDVALSRVPGPLPEGLRMGVYESARVSAHGGLRDVALSRVPGPLPEGLRMAVYESYPALYGRFMVHVVALQEGTMPLKQVDNDVFQILGYDGGFHQKYGKYVVRDASCISHRPDLYQMFVEWSTSAPPLVGNKKHKSVPFSFGVIGLPAAPRETLRLDSLTSEVLVKDLIALDAVLSMSQTMQTALCTGVCVRGVPFSFGAMRDRWQKELLNRVSTVAAHK